MGMFMENEILYALTTLIRAAERLNNTVNPTAGPIECLHRMKLEAAIIIAKDTVERVEHKVEQATYYIAEKQEDGPKVPEDVYKVYVQEPPLSLRKAGYKVTKCYAYPNKRTHKPVASTLPYAVGWTVDGETYSISYGPYETELQCLNIVGDQELRILKIDEPTLKILWIYNTDTNQWE